MTLQGEFITIFLDPVFFAQHIVNAILQSYFM